MSNGYAFEEHCLPHYDAALRLARRLTGNRQRGLDLVQDAMVRALGAWSRFVPESENAVKSWLMLIVTNTHFAQYRKDKFRAKCRADHHADIVQAVFEKGEYPIVDTSLGDEVSEAVGQLDPSNREVMIRYAVQEQTAKEIAAEMAIPPTAVYSRLQRNRDTLKKKLRGYAASEYGIVDANHVTEQKLGGTSEPVEIVQKDVDAQPLM